MTGNPPLREVRANFDDTTLTVYQAYSPEIAGPAVAARTFVPPFKPDRMTWIKPSFLWMMYRSGWATKPGQERILAIRITRAGFDEALANACLSHHDPDVYPSHEAWQQRLASTTVRVQWDPERTLDLNPLPYRCLQLGISPAFVHSYVADWITDIQDITPTARNIHASVQRRDLAKAHAQLPTESSYPLTAATIEATGARVSPG